MKTLTDFESAQPFAVHFFTQALENRHMVNAYIMRGQDMATSYAVVLRLAQIINCSDNPSPSAACGVCQSCRWIDENAHPGVITLSNLTYFVGAKKGTDPDEETEDIPNKKKKKPSAVITVDQLRVLLSKLALHSGGYNRIVILTGASEASALENKPVCPPPHDWTPYEDGAQFQLRPLDRKNFSDAPSNKFLKILEEPPNDVVFFLLTDASERLLETIVSRCQSVPFKTPPDFYKQRLSVEEQSQFGNLMKTLTQPDYLKSMEVFSTVMAETGLDSEEVLLRFEVFFADYIKQAMLDDPVRFHRARKALGCLEKARWMIRDKTREDAALESMFLQLAAL